MLIKKNWFTYFVLTVYEIFILLALFNGFNSTVKDREYPFFFYAIIVVFCIITPIFVYFVGRLINKINLANKIKSKNLKIIEICLVTLLMAVGVIARVYFIEKVRIVPTSDFNTYYQVAELLSKGTLATDGKALCDYISCFPHVIGFPFILSLLFKIVGVNFVAGLYLNLVASTISFFLVYEIAKMLCGKKAGLIALSFAVFSPSMIMYGSLLAGEPIFTCLLLVAIYLVAFLFVYGQDTGKLSVIIVLTLLLGVVLAVAGAVRPMSIILIIAYSMVLLCSNKKFTTQMRSKVGVFRCAVAKGWFRIVLMLISYFITSTIINGAIATTIQKQLPRSSASFGYNLLIGVNVESMGTWNQEDADLLSNTYDLNNDPNEAHIVCRNKAFEKIASSPKETINLAFEKFSDLWGNDKYADYWMNNFLNQQNMLTEKTKIKLKTIDNINNVFYLGLLLFSTIAGYFLFKSKKGSPLLVLSLFFIGTALLQMVLESQNRYHYDVLPIFFILASYGITSIFNISLKKKAEVQDEKLNTNNLSLEEKKTLEMVAAQDMNLPSISHEPFDMEKALREGHIEIVVSEKYKDELEKTKAV